MLHQPKHSPAVNFGFTIYPPECYFYDIAASWCVALLAGVLLAFSSTSLEIQRRMQDYLQSGCTERHYSSNSSPRKKNRSVRDSKDTVLFHFKVGTQAWYIFQITICKQSYKCSVTHIFSLFHFCAAKDNGRNLLTYSKLSISLFLISVCTRGL